ncbi:ExeM/NucH family extracellular endonuclease [Argonema galeatum]|uniref:ExeM/NucH family extracellular endonuclease n=1 Tax=Argonema galeatum TaxID=2942762 RepID=UPI002011485E|nr:ExeM/NucH family extracellular endonuclease [Argonema galeatum]MCL1465141.1 ExeM/NucH family extracellular endonuclease [Argonema galeatum A003/A1]
MPLNTGDIAIVGYITNGSPDSFSFVNLVGIAAGEVIYFTDNGWTGSAFRASTATDGDGNENLIRFTANAAIAAGTVIRSIDTSPNFTWTKSGTIGTTSSGSYADLSLSQSGEQIAAFQSTNTNNPLNSGITAIHQIDNTGTFENATSSNEGNLVPGLSQASNTAVLFNNSATYAAFNFATLSSGTKSEWLAAINNAANWTFGSSTSLPTGSIVVGTPQPDLTVSLSDSPDPLILGNNLTYTLTVNNNGAANASGVVVDFTLPTGLNVVSSTETNGFTRTGNSGTISFASGAINASSNATLTVQVTPTVSGNLTSGTAVVDPGNTIAESNESNNTATAVTTTVNGTPQPDLSVGTSTPGLLTVNTPFNYILDIQNNGTANASGIELTFTLPANVTYNSSNVLGGGFGSPTVSGSTLTFTGGSINSSNFAQIEVNVTPTVAGTLGSGTLVADPNNNITESNEANNTIGTATPTVNPAANTPPTISENSTTPFLNLAATGTGYVSGVINDPTDPAKTLGIDFTVADAETANPTVSILSSSNTSVVPLANLNLTNTGNNYNLKINPASVGYSDITVRVSDGSATADYIVKYAASAASINPASTRFLTGASDASTAIAIDANYMLVGDDEDQKLRLFDRANSGSPLNSFDFTSSLGLTQLSGGVPREVDIEASTKIGNRIFWLGSHSNSSSGSSRPNRYRLFATDISGTGASTTLNYVGRYDNLRTDLIAWGDANGYSLSSNAATGVAPELPNGFNIEGLTIAPDNTTGYVAFRAPNVPTATRNKALIAPITNFADLVTGAAASANIGGPIELDLGGRGIREIQRNASNQYLIIAGPSGSATGTAPNDFRLYSWTGNLSDTPQLLLTDLTGLNADGSFESIVEVPNSLTNGTQVQLLVDNGDSIFYNDGTIAKDLTQDNFQKSRSEIITISTPTKIHDIQGTGSTFNAAFSGTQTIEGIITRTFLGSTKLNGFYIQEEDIDSDGNAATSEAIFVYDPTGLFTGNVGDKVRVTGTVGEYTSSSSSLTQLSSLTSVTNLGASTLPTVTNIQLPVSDLERYEGMLVNVSATTDNLTVTENFQLGRFGQIVLSATGASDQAGTDARLDQYTQFNTPSVSGYAAYQADIANRRIYLDDGSGVQNSDPILFGRGGNPLSASNTLRGGDTVANITGVLDQRFEGYRIQTSTGVNFTPANPRPNTPPSVGGTLKVASFNVLNYFNGDGVGGGFPTARGAENLTEFNRQRDKIIQAIVTSGADVLGLMELENDGYGSTSAIQNLVNGLNTVAGAGTYTFVNPGTSLATDAITVGLIYKPSQVTPVGAAATMPDGYGTGAFDLVGRKPLAQTFQQNSTGGQFTAVVNHFKSKGSSAGGSGDADAFDGQGLSNGTRTRQSQDLATWLATNPTGTNDSDYLIVGDLNAYAKEDPITTLANAGYNNLLPISSYSYVFDGQVGSLDHALASSSLAAQVTGAEKWHINADEPSVLDYNTNFKSAGQVSSLYNADPYRSSDHDPVIVGVNLAVPNLTIEAIDGNAAEAGSDVGVFRISRSGGGSVGNLNVSYTVAGQAISNDYNPSLIGTATIATGQSFVDVAITPVDDNLVEGNETLTLNLVDTSDYNLGASNTATVNIADNDIAGVTISKSNTNVTEGGATDNYAIVLTSQPTNVVQVNVTPSNNQINLGAGAGNPLSLNFTPNTWNLPQAVTVTAIDDTQVEGNHTSNISHSASSSDSDYNINIGNVAVNITDNDTQPLNLSLTVNPNSFSEGAGAIATTATITRTGSTASQLTVNLASSDTSEATVPNSVIIPVGQTAANFAVAGVEDNIVDGSQSATITATANGFTNATTNLTVTDNDVAGVTIIQPANGMNLVEGGAISSYQLLLNSQPTADVAISFDTGNQIYPISNINFTPNNWNIAQTITVAAVDDTKVEGNHAGTVSHSAISNDLNYNGLGITFVSATITENDIAQVDDCCGCDELEKLGENSYKGKLPDSNPPHDIIIGNANPNILIGGIGNDTIFGRGADDLLFGNQGQDVINGNEGNDIIFAGKDDDFVRGGQNDDLISGDLGNDTLCGDLGNDTVLGMEGDDVLLGSKGDDILNGNQGNDTICGGEGNDIVRGGQDNDLVSGGSGNDTLYGDIGNDTICGCEGNDFLFGGAGNDFLKGGKGRDIFALKIGAGSDIIADFIVGEDSLGLSGNLRFSNLTITQGSGNQAADTLVRVTATNELLASLTGVAASSITGSAIAFISNLTN